MRIVIASHNPGKIKEFEYLLKDMNLQVVPVSGYPEIGEVEETGSTFEENARLKAETISRELQTLTLADDSGLIVPSLGDEPGINSARYSGLPKDDTRNNQKLLEKMKGFKGEKRKAYFVSTLVVSYPGFQSLVVEGKVEGIITEYLAGTRGFGYDPLFYYPPFKKTFAELSCEDKNAISHRAAAMEKLKTALPAWLKELDNDENIGFE